MTGSRWPATSRGRAGTDAPAAGDDPATWTLAGEDVTARLGVDPRRGLSETEAQRRLAEAGANELAERPPKPPWRMFAGQFANTMIVVLLAAAVITAFVGEFSDTVVIAVIVVLNAAIGFVQEYRAERAMAALKRMAAAHARVVRDGEVVTVPARLVVPGDVVHLEAGDVVPADARLLEAPNLRVNEAALTGESVPVDKSAAALGEDDGAAVADRVNTVFKGTAVVYGRGVAVVVGTGMATALGRIAGLLEARPAPPTPLQRRLAVLGTRLALAALAICVVVFVAGVARGEPVPLMFLTAVTLAVAAIPEALPAVVTVALAMGAGRMARQHALVRKLPAVESLGSVTVICTDKTGTLTQGRMKAQAVWTPAGAFGVSGSGYDPDGALLHDGGRAGDDTVLAGGTAPAGTHQDQDPHDLFLAAALCNDAVLQPPRGPDEPWDVAGDPTEGALLVLAAKAGLRRADLDRTFPRLAEVPFDSSRRRMTTLHADPRGGVQVACKGALEAVLEVVTEETDAGPSTPAAVGERARAAAQAYAAGGQRVLAIAGTRLSALPDRPEDAEARLTLYGLVAMADPLREESIDAVAACQAAGIRPVIITGDHPETARAIASQLELVAGPRGVMTGAELAEQSARGLGRQVADIAVFARTTPEQKLDIVEAWKARGDIVAMTGDGVNDAPALRRADIGVAMGLTGSDVSREAADMVLVDDNFATIVTAVREGRRIYDNIRRFVRYTLTSNSGEIWVMLLAPFLGLPLPLLPVQILWINLVTDGLPGLALGVEPPEADVMRRPPRSPAESVFSRGLWQHVVVVGLLMGVIPIGLGLWGHATGRPWQTMVFTSLALLQLGHALAVRSESQSLAARGLRTNRPLLAAVAGSALLQVGAVYWGPAQAILRTEALGVAEMLAVGVASTGALVAVELEKLVRRRQASPTRPRPRTAAR